VLGDIALIFAWSARPDQVDVYHDSPLPDGYLTLAPPIAISTSALHSPLTICLNYAPAHWLNLSGYCTSMAAPVDITTIDPPAGCLRRVGSLFHSPQPAPPQPIQPSLMVRLPHSQHLRLCLLSNDPLATSGS
jgi:hypothetical protein